MKKRHNASIQLYTALRSKSIVHNMIDNGKTNERYELVTFCSHILFTLKQRLAENGLMIDFRSIK